jgi:hypothetical protein
MVGVELEVTVRAKAPARISDQRMGLRLNGHVSAMRPLSDEFEDFHFDLPRAQAQAGENELCLEFARGAAKGATPDPIAAHVQWVLANSRTPTFPSPIWGLAHAPAGKE